MNNQDRAAEVIRTWQQRHKGELENHTDWATQNLAGDLHQAGLITPNLPEPYRDMTSPYETVWYLTGTIGAIHSTEEGIVIFGLDCCHLPTRLVLTKAESETIAHALLAAAQHQEEA